MSIEDYVKKKEQERSKEKNKLTRQERLALILKGVNPDKVNEVKKPTMRRFARKNKQY
ncbi:MAG: hypothetical protein Unbinned4512contig1001_21 [Prokaryotic dsDNA virus sp.]|nr:MAG: hypothetical protein Unbinned4512contig1001_21 [Prokaryotic dsDNA virus sp.]|tara:strand:- start:6400 stop:6573 length:174 start_codon:yes stop_codon:yes gene_type:complete